MCFSVILCVFQVHVFQGGVYFRVVCFSADLCVFQGRIMAVLMRRSRTIAVTLMISVAVLLALMLIVQPPHTVVDM